MFFVHKTVLLAHKPVFLVCTLNSFLSPENKLCFQYIKLVSCTENSVACTEKSVACTDKSVICTEKSVDCTEKLFLVQGSRGPPMAGTWSTLLNDYQIFSVYPWIDYTPCPY